MKGKKIALTTLLVTFMATIVPSVLYAQEEVPYGPWVDQLTFQAEPDWAKNVDMLKNNEVQIHISDISDPELFAEIRASAELDYIVGFGGFDELTFNPYGPTFLNGELNPFNNPKIREAMNMLVDRNHIAEELAGGLGTSKTTHLNPNFPDYGRLADTAIVIETKYSHDPETAETIISSELETMGAVKEDGKWTYNGNPITIKVLIRTEDERKQIGDYVSDLLEGLGFEVERMYKPSREAAPIWLEGEPMNGEFHIYTGGWISTVISRDDTSDYAFFYTDMGLPFPLWLAYTPDPGFYQIAKRLDTGDWETFDERQELMAEAIGMSMEDSVRIFLIDNIQPFAYRKEIEVAGDLAGGFGNPLWSRTLKIKDQVGGLVKASDREAAVQPWNPVAGTNWLYDTHILTSVVDGDYIFNPYTGLPMPNRFVSATLELLEGAKTISSSDWLELKLVNKIEVPSDAWYDWDVANQKVIFAPAGTTARAKATVNYGDVIGKVEYHDGSVMTLADWLVPWALDFERADSTSALYDAASPPAFASFRDMFKGMRVVSESPLIIEYYIDYANIDAELIVAQACAILNIDSPTWGTATNWPSVPWHVKAIGILAEEKGLLAFSSKKAADKNVEWMSYIGGPSLAVLDDLLTEAKDTGYIPFENLANVTTEEISARYDNLRSFYETYRHFYPANGPYILETMDYVGHIAVLEAFRGYQYRADRWSWLTAPPIPESSLEVPGRVVSVPGSEIAFTLELSYKGKPYANNRIDFVKYVVIDSVGNVITSGQALPKLEGEWEIKVREALEAGTYNLMTIALSKDVAIPGSLQTPFTVTPLEGLVESTIADAETRIRADLATSLTDVETSLTEDISTLQATVSSLQTSLYLAIGIAVVAIIVGIYAAVAKK